jgi:hypothetical protein
MAQHDRLDQLQLGSGRECAPSELPPNSAALAFASGTARNSVTALIGRER